MWASLALLGGMGLAGAVGAGTRYLVGRFIAERMGSQFPVGTLVINVTGAFLIGLVFALTGRNVLTPALQMVLATGFLGGYTTYSTMSWEGVQLARGGSTQRSLLYIGATAALGLVAAVVGLVLGEAL